MSTYQQQQQQQLLQAYYGQMQQAQPNQKFKSTLCNIWLMEGICSRGRQCHYAHGIKELNYRQEDAVFRHYKTSICQFWQQRGFCSNGDQCKWAHGEAELRRMDSPSNGMAYYQMQQGASASSSGDAATAAAAAAAGMAEYGIGPQLDVLLQQRQSKQEELGPSRNGASTAAADEDNGVPRKRNREEAGVDIDSGEEQ